MNWCVGERCREVQRGSIRGEAVKCLESSIAMGYG